MRNNIRVLASGFIAALMLISTATPTVNAAATATESITLSPASKRYQVDAGTLKTDELTIVNDGQLPYDFILYARPYSIRDEAYSIPDFTTTASNTDVYKWIQFDQTHLHIEPGKTLKIGYSMRVPSGAAPGGHYGVLFAETQPTGGESGNVVARKKRVGMVVYATVNGQFRTAGKDLGTSIPWLQFHAPLRVTSKVGNDGNSDFIVKTEYKVSDVFGNLKYSESKDYPVLPESKRLMTFDWAKAPWFGLYHANVKTSFLDQNHSKSGYVLLAPRWLLVVLAITIVGGVIYVALRRKR